MKRKLWIAVAGVGLLGVGAWRWQQPTAAPRPLACQFQVGEDLAFRVTSAVTAQGQGKETRREIRATMWWHVREQRGNEWSVVAALSDLQLDGEDTAERRHQLSLPFQVAIRTDCHFQAVHFDPSTDLQARRELEGIVRAGEVSVPTTPLAEWVAKHRDTLGEYDAKYQRVAQGQGVQIEKQKLRYDTHSLPTLPAQLGGSLRVHLTESKASMTLDTGGRWVRQATDHTRLRIEHNGQLLSDVDATTHVYREPAQKAPELLAAVDVRTLSVTSAEAPKAQDVTPLPPPPDPVLSAMDLQAALLDFTQRLTATKDGVHQATLRLASYLSTHPQAIEQIVQQMRSGQIDAKLHAQLFLALERTGTKAAERALGSALLDRSMSTMNRMRAAAALQDIPRPSVDTAQTLLTQARSAGVGEEAEVASAALLAAGALGRRAQKLSPAATDLVRGELQDRLRTQRRTEDLNVTLDAIGNSGDRELSSALSSYRKSDSVETRAHAAHAFRRMELPVMEPALTQWLHDESDSRVTRAIGLSLAERLRESAQAPQPDTVAAIAARLPNESDPAARTALINVLGLAASTQPAAKQALVSQFSRETEVPLKVLIGRFVAATDLP